MKGYKKRTKKKEGGSAAKRSRKQKARQKRAVERKRELRAHYNWRDRRIKEMGFETYRDYLRSDLWAGIRRAVLEASSDRCYGCGHRANQVHHGNYFRATLHGDSFGDLYAVCGRCHRKIERHRRWGKLPPVEATRELEKIRRARINLGIRLLTTG